VSGWGLLGQAACRACRGTAPRTQCVFTWNQLLYMSTTDNKGVRDTQCAHAEIQLLLTGAAVSQARLLL
jgi:hypothetical protein